MGAVGAIVMTVLALGILFGVSFIVFPMISEEQRPICENISQNQKANLDVPIYSTEDGVVVEGEFFLGIGRVDTYPAYYFYTGDDVRGFERQILNTREINVLVFRDSARPHMIKKLRYTMQDQGMGAKICTPSYVIELHVPPDTLIKEV